MKMTKDIEALLDYCQDDREWESFWEQICDNGSDALTNGENLYFQRRKNPIDNEAIQELMEKAAMDPNQNHIWAIAHRIRKELENGSND
jgi:hypothetical protein